MSEKNHHIIDLQRLPIGRHDFDISLDDAFFGELEKTEVLGGKVEGKVTLNLREEDYQLDIAVHGTVFVVCDRCLDPMPLEIDATETMFPNDGWMNDDAAEPLHGEIDLSWLAYEIISINIPLVHSHQSGECNKQMELLLHDHLCDEPDPEE